MSNIENYICKNIIQNMNVTCSIYSKARVPLVEYFQSRARIWTLKRRNANEQARRHRRRQHGDQRLLVATSRALGNLREVDLPIYMQEPCYLTNMLLIYWIFINNDVSHETRHNFRQCAVNYVFISVKLINIDDQFLEYLIITLLFLIIDICKEIRK